MEKFQKVIKIAIITNTCKINNVLFLKKFCLKNLFKNVNLFIINWFAFRLYFLFTENFLLQKNFKKLLRKEELFYIFAYLLNMWLHGCLNSPVLAFHLLWCSLTWSLLKTTLYLWENESKNGTWPLNIILKVVLTSCISWQALRVSWGSWHALWESMAYVLWELIL